ncbi:MAG: flippase-like domain-containing protein [Candidatus Nanohaloarchaea archaeon]|nr:flippase-like domain-containing protein [Candidatus Nanohaloarchaea archaeon]
MLRDAVKAGAGFAVALGVIGLFTWAVGWRDILAATGRASPGLLLLGGVTAFAGFLTIGVAWWVVVRRVAGYTLTRGLWVFLATQFANSVTPLGQFGGEPFIAYLLSRDSDLPIEESFGAVLAADIVNTAPFFTFSFLGIFSFLFYFPLNGTVSTVLKAVTGLTLLVTIGLFTVWRYRPAVLGGLERIGAWVADGVDHSDIDGEQLKQRGEGFYTVFEELLGERRTLGLSLAVAHLSTVFGVAGLYLLLLSLGVDAPVSALLFILPASMLAGYLPLPGGLGGIELAMAGLLNTVASVPLPVASAAALLYRIATYWAGMMLLGGIAASDLSIDIFAQ